MTEKEIAAARQGLIAFVANLSKLAAQAEARKKDAA